eukprot:2217002-Pleurochrysis_carterae.AAC.2
MLVVTGGAEMPERIPSFRASAACPAGPRAAFGGGRSAAGLYSVAAGRGDCGQPTYQRRGRRWRAGVTAVPQEG